MISPLGFTRTEAKVYEWLLANPDSDVTAIAAAHCEPADDVQQALDGLVGRRLVIADSSARFRSVEPGLGLADQARTVRADVIARLSGFFELVEEIAGNVESTGRSAPAGPAVETLGLADRDLVRARLSDASRATRKSVRNMQQYASPVEEVVLGLPLALESIARGISSQSIYGVELLCTDHHVDAAEQLLRAGSGIRCGPTPFTRLLIGDESFAFLTSTGTERAATFVRDPDLVMMLVRVFDECWSLSRDVAIGQISPAARQMQVLRLLHAGASEDRAARELGLSTRQLRRDLSALMTIAGADNRIALGAYAAKHGWI